MLLERYIPPNLRGPIRDAGNIGYSILDNVIGIEDGYRSAGERFKDELFENPKGVAKQIGSGMLEGAKGLLSDPIGTAIGTAKGVITDVAQSTDRAARGAAGYLPEGVELKSATMEQIRAANDAYTGDLFAMTGVIPAAGAGRAAVRAAGNVDVGARTADAIGLGRSIASGDLEGIGEVFQRSGEARSLSAARGPNKDDLDPLGYQGVKMDDYLSNADIGILDLGVNLARKPMSWESLENDLVIPFYGDRTSGGMAVDRINDVKFDRPVITEGGVDFMRGPAAQSDNAIWASNSNITKRLSDNAEAAARNNPNSRIVGMTGSMAPNANDFATMTGGAVGELIQNAGVPRKVAVEFDEIMRAADPSFVGVNSPDLRKWLESTSSPLRKTFIRLADSKPMKQGGFPDMALGRYAVTDTTQRDMPAGMFGLGAAEIDTLAPRTFNTPKGNQPQANVPHNTYNSQISGGYLGSLPPVPQGLLFKDVYDSMEGQLTKAGKPVNSAHKTHAIKTKVPAQKITPEVLDGILNYLSRQGR